MTSNTISRSERLFMEQQVRRLDDMMRTMNDMRTILDRRIRRADTRRIPPRQRQMIPPSLREPPLFSQNEETNIIIHGPNHYINQGSRIVRNLDQELSIYHPTPPTNTIRVKNYKIKYITISQQNSLLHQDEPCPICLHTHHKIDSLTCNCNHSFGTECLYLWKKNCSRSKKILTCPICRVPISIITQFKISKKSNPISIAPSIEPPVESSIAPSIEPPVEPPVESSIAPPIKKLKKFIIINDSSSTTLV